MPDRIGQRIQHARRRMGMRQSDLGVALAVSRSAVANWESDGGACPSLQNLARIALLTGSSLDWLATGRGEPHAFPGKRMDAAATPDADDTRLLHAFHRSPRTMRKVILRMLGVGAAAAE
mgnify:CR=1 FL=1